MCLFGFVGGVYVVCIEVEDKGFRIGGFKLVGEEE